MPHTHTRADPSPSQVDPAEQAQQRRALKLMAAVLIPVALATIIGLVLLWPSGTSDAQRAAEQYIPEGTLYPTGEVVAIEPYECGGPATGAGDGGGTLICATATLTIEDGPEANENVRLQLSPDCLRGRRRTWRTAGAVPGSR